MISARFLALLVGLILLIKPFHLVYAYLTDLNGLLSSHLKVVTKNGIRYNAVNYDAWAKDERHQKVLAEISSINPKNFNDDNERLAFWINTYNVLTIDLIIQENERESIKNLGSFLNSPWKKYKWSIAKKDYSLDEIEHDIIRKMNESRIHFAINCAAKSCPDLRSEAYKAELLDSQLSEQTSLTFKNETKGFVKVSHQNRVKVSKVMDWFSEDFNDGDLKSWLKTYVANQIDSKTKIDYFDYDWSLNLQ